MYCQVQQIDAKIFSTVRVLQKLLSGFSLDSSCNNKIHVIEASCSYTTFKIHFRSLCIYSLLTSLGCWEKSVLHKLSWDPSWAQAPRYMLLTIATEANWHWNIKLYRQSLVSLWLPQNDPWKLPRKHLL